MKKENESYSEYYERLKENGLKAPFIQLQSKPEKEEYKEITDDIIPGIDKSRYYISNYGNVYDELYDKNKYLRSDKNGYKYVSIKSSQYRVHRLEMLVFDYNDNYDKLQVNHIDGNPSNNAITNLEWVTPKENSDHAMVYGLHKMNGTKNPNNKLSEDQVREICKLIETGKYYDTEIAEMYNVSYTNISDIHKGKIWKNISSDYDLSNRKIRGLTESQVREVCEMLTDNTVTLADIARKFNVAPAAIGAIKKGKVWTSVTKDYPNINQPAIPKKFSKDQVREICELIQTGKYYDTEIAKMYNTNSTFIHSLRAGLVHKDITKDYDMTIRKKI